MVQVPWPEPEQNVMNIAVGGEGGAAEPAEPEVENVMMDMSSENDQEVEELKQNDVNEAPQVEVQELLNDMEQEDDDDDVVGGINQVIPASVLQQDAESVMNININQDSLTVFCAQNGIAQHLETFRSQGFDSVDILVLCSREDLEKMGLLMGQSMKCCSIFQKYRNEVVNGNGAAQNSGNIHYHRRRNRNNNNNDNDENIMLNGYVEENLTGKVRIKYTGAVPLSIQHKLRDTVFDVILNESDSTDCKQVRIVIDNRTKNGENANARYFYNEETNTWPNAPVMLAYNGARRLKQVGLISVENENFKTRGLGGRASWTGTIARHRLSTAWDNGSSAQREELHGFVKGTSGVNWIKYATRTGDILNARELGLIGLKEPEFDKSLAEIISSDIV